MLDRLIAKGATIVKEPKVWASRPKVSGRMWDGEAVVRYEGWTFTFYLWHHGDDEYEDALTSLLPHFSIKYFAKGDGGPQGRPGTHESYDPSWHTKRVYRTDKSAALYLHKEGWAYNRTLADHPLVATKWVKLTEKDEAGLVELGFVKLFEF